MKPVVKLMTSKQRFIKSLKLIRPQLARFQPPITSFNLISEDKIHNYKSPKVKSIKKIGGST